jgi:hypothetical protein
MADGVGEGGDALLLDEAADEEVESGTPHRRFAGDFDADGQDGKFGGRDAVERGDVGHGGGNANEFCRVAQ